MVQVSGVAAGTVTVTWSPVAGVDAYYVYKANPSLAPTGTPPNPPVAPAQVTLKYISNSGFLCDTTNGTPTLVLALECFIMSGIYRGLHEDPQEADKMWLAGEQMLQRARTRYDQQKPKRMFFNSRITASRRIRRPYPPIGNYNWGGSDTPG